MKSLKFEDFIPSKYNIKYDSIPLRVWKKSWPIPKKVKSIRYKFRTRTVHKTHVNIIRFGLLGEVKKRI